MFEGHADTPGAKLWYWDTGGDGAALILCHPASQSSQIWSHQKDAFWQAGYRVIAYSRRGYFRSERGPDGDPGTALGDLANLLDYLNIEHAHVLGAAAGGITAAGLAVAHPGRVRSLILAGTIVSPDEPEWRDLYGRLGIADVRPHVSTEFLELGPAYRAADPDGTAQFAALSEMAAPDGPVRQPLGVAVTWPALERVSAPVLLITGEADLFAPPPLQELIARHLPNRRLETIRAVGHAGYWEQPDAFNAAVLDFLNGIDRP